MDNDFDKKFKNILSNPPEFPVDKAGWKNVVAGLDKLEPPPHTKKNSFFASRNLLWLLLVFLSGFLGYFFAQNQNLKAQLVEKDNLPFIQNKQIDTTIQKHVTVIYDTIYRKILVDDYPSNHGSRKPEYSYSGNSAFFFQNDLPDFKTIAFDSFGKNQTQDIRLNYLYNNVITEDKSNNDKISVNNSAGEFSNRPIQLLPLESRGTFYLKSLDSNFPNILSATYFFDNSEYERKRRRRKRLQNMTPSNIAIGVHAGIGYDLSLDFYDAKNTNNSFGVDTEIGFGKNLSMVIGAKYRRQNMKLDGEYDNQPINLDDFPILPPQDINDELHEIYWNAEYLEIPFGFKYSFLKNKKLQPYFGLGLVSRKVLKSKLAFEYYASGGEEYEESETGFLSKTFEVNNAWGTLGAQFNVTKNWLFFVEGGYQFDWKNKNLTKLEAVQLLQSNVGILYQF